MVDIVLIVCEMRFFIIIFYLKNSLRQDRKQEAKFLRYLQ